MTGSPAPITMSARARRPAPARLEPARRRRPCETASCRADDGACVVDASACVCATDADCDDSNPCTNDACAADGSSCSNEPAVGSPCDDGAWCTEQDACNEDGTCGGVPRLCQDPRDCAMTRCDEDADTCVVDTTGCECGADTDCDTDYTCAEATCDLITGRCAVDTQGCECLENSDCDDGSPCTLDICTTTQTCRRDPRANGIACGDEGICVDGTCRDGMIVIPAGYVRVGCDATTYDCPTTATPTVDISFSRFAIDKFETTTRRYKACVDAGACTEPEIAATSTWGDEAMLDHPVNHVTWLQAGNLCAFESKCLCSESEWERAARGAGGFIWPWGNEPEPTCDRSNLDVCGLGFLVAVGTKAPDRSPSGVMDMLGNIEEWVQDCHRHRLEHLPIDGTAFEAAEACFYRVAKGASCSHSNDFSQLHIRRNRTPTIPHPYVGFRCGRSL